MGYGSLILGCGSLILGCGEGFETVFHNREVGVGDDGGKGMGFITHHEKEW